MINKKYIIDGERRLVATSAMEFVYQEQKYLIQAGTIGGIIGEKVTISDRVGKIWVDYDSEISEDIEISATLCVIKSTVKTKEGYHSCIIMDNLHRDFIIENCIICNSDMINLEEYLEEPSEEFKPYTSYCIRNSEVSRSTLRIFGYIEGCKIYHSNIENCREIRSTSISESDIFNVSYIGNLDDCISLDIYKSYIRHICDEREISALSLRADIKYADMEGNINIVGMGSRYEIDHIYLRNETDIFWTSDIFCSGLPILFYRKKDDTNNKQVMVVDSQFTSMIPRTIDQYRNMICRKYYKEDVHRYFYLQLIEFAKNLIKFRLGGI